MKPNLIGPFVLRRLTLFGLLLITITLLAGCELRLRGVSLAEIDQAEAAWQANPVLNYRMVTVVKRPDEIRRFEVEVRNGEIVRGELRLYDAVKKTWLEPYELSEDQAFPFTAPGMFDTVRGALRSSGRAIIRVKMGQDPPFPQRIELGPVWDRGQMVRGTETEIEVREFERLQ
ncbi:MAG: hypothetical protein GXP42_06740 [Chloroflexi bacterium]|nr:hypothetical protein [Chloroflexota bacterium]